MYISIYLFFLQFFYAKKYAHTHTTSQSHTHPSLHSEEDTQPPKRMTTRALGQWGGRRLVQRTGGAGVSGVCVGVGGADSREEDGQRGGTDIVEEDGASAEDWGCRGVRATWAHWGYGRVGSGARWRRGPTHGMGRGRGRRRLRRWGTQARSGSSGPSV